MNAPQVHLMLNHVPVLGVVFATAALAAGLALRRATLIRFAFTTMVVISVLAVPVYFSGNASEEQVEHMPGVQERSIERHEDVAKAVTIVLVVLGLVSLGVLLRYRHDPVPQKVATALLIGGFALCGAMAWTAHTGGQIRHDELRATQSAATSAEHEQEDRDD